MRDLLRPVAMPDPAERWAQEASAISTWYPSFQYVERKPHLDLIALEETPREKLEATDFGNPVRTWVGWIQPFGDDVGNEEIAAIVADLNDDRVVNIARDGALRHATACARDHRLPDTLCAGRRLTTRYKIEIACRIPPGHPVVRSLDPPIVADSYGERSAPPHLLGPIRALCVTFPPDDAWNWDRGDTIAQYLDQASIWLAKHTVWTETRERLGAAKAIWIGGATPHGPVEMLRRVRPSAPCHCGSGQTYATCCLPKDRGHVLGVTSAA